MTLIGCWRFTGTPTQNGVLTVGNDKIMPVLQDSLGEFTKPSDSRITETKKGHIFGPANTEELGFCFVSTVVGGCYQHMPELLAHA